jgi:hypothetical protein
MVTRSVRSLGFVIRNSRSFNNTDTVKRLYFAFVRSKLEYASVVWSTGYKSQIEDLEKIQRRLLKYLSFKVDGTYPENGHPQHDLLCRWNVDSLLHRRVCHSLIFLHRLINNVFDCPELLGKINFHVPRMASRNQLTFYMDTPRTNTQKFSPLFMMCHNSNKLPSLDIFNCTIRDIKGMCFNTD